MKEYRLGTSKQEVYGFFPEKTIKKIQVDGKQLAGIRIGNEIFVFDSFCPHRGASLLQATCNGIGELICPLHHYRFDLKTGNVRAGSCADLKIYHTRLDEWGLLIILP
jgi:nitrite reductase/ring-hydroxylating ferredoxin subunit